MVTKWVFDIAGLSCATLQQQQALNLKKGNGMAKQCVFLANQLGGVCAQAGRDSAPAHTHTHTHTHAVLMTVTGQDWVT